MTGRSVTLDKYRYRRRRSRHVRLWHVLKMENARGGFARGRRPAYFVKSPMQCLANEKLYVNAAIQESDGACAAHLSRFIIMSEIDGNSRGTADGRRAMNQRQTENHAA